MAAHRRILIIDDDPLLRQTLAEHLTASGFAVVAVGDAAHGLAEVEGHELVVLNGDIADGAAALFLSGMRRKLATVPVLMLAGPATPAACAADAVVAKPLRLGQFVAQIAALLERPASTSGQIGPWRFDPLARRLENADGRLVRLTDKEAAILCHLRRAAGLVSRDRLLAEVWGYSTSITTHTLETHIYRLRRKIEPDPARATLLLTEPGGYRLAGS